ncbi:MAG: RNA polymerase sigma-70 factor [Roseivirga sp.]|nr:RNA polymerase sigma-70 factor [Roseivirga sp.]
MFFDRKRERFSALFDRHYQRLFNYALKYTRDKELSEELVQETFVKLWEHIGEISQEAHSIEAFLITTLKNKIIDSYRRKAVKDKHHELIGSRLETSAMPEDHWDLINQIQSIQDALEPRTKEIFRLSREELLPYKEIAQQCMVSVKTVESHISKALKAFREGLKDYL